MSVNSSRVSTGFDMKFGKIKLATRDLQSISQGLLMGKKKLGKGILKGTKEKCPPRILFLRLDSSHGTYVITYLPSININRRNQGTLPYFL